jgi:TRAP transporter TAXI family solute receptor
MRESVDPSTHRLMERRHFLAMMTTLAAGCRAAATPPTPERALTFGSSFLGFAKNAVPELNRLSGPRIRLLEATHSVDVASAIHRRVADFGTAQADVAYLAYRDGIGDESYPHDGLRGMAVLWPTYLLICVPRDSPAVDVGDLRGKRVGLAPYGMGANMLHALLEAYGMTEDDIATRYQSIERSREELRAGTLDAYIWPFPLLTSQITERLQYARARLLSISSRASQHLQANYPFLSRVTLPAAVTGNQHAHSTTISLDFLLLCHKDLSEPIAYQLTSRFFRMLPALAALSPLTELIDTRTSSATPIPLHAGSARYHREREVLTDFGSS